MLKAILDSLMVNPILGRFIDFSKRNSACYNIGYDGNDRRKALLSYCVDANFVPVDELSFNTNRKECLVILSKLLKQGYQVDLVDCNNDLWTSKSEYDLVIGFGHPFRTANLSKDGIRCIYLTEQHPDYSMKQETERINYLCERKNIKWPLERTSSYYRTSDFNICSVFIVLSRLSEEYLLKEVGVDDSVLYKVYPTGIDIDELNYSELKLGKDFICLSSRGAVHKGLDILVESFSQSNIDSRLHIFGLDSRGVNLLKKIVRDDRIIYYNRIDVNSDVFREIREKSAFIISLSCSESSNTGVLTGMRYGLIPVVLKSVAVDTFGYGVILDGHNVNSIKAQLENISKLSCSEIRTESKKVFDVANKHYTIDRYSDEIETIIREISKYHE